MSHSDKKTPLLLKMANKKIPFLLKIRESFSLPPLRKTKDHVVVRIFRPVEQEGAEANLIGRIGTRYLSYLLTLDDLVRSCQKIEEDSFTTIFVSTADWDSVQLMRDDPFVAQRAEVINSDHQKGSLLAC